MMLLLVVMLLCLFFFQYFYLPVLSSHDNNTDKTIVLLFQLIRYTFVIGYAPNKGKTEPPSWYARNRDEHIYQKISVIYALSLLPVAFLSDAPTAKAIPGLPARALVLRRDWDRLHRACWFFACRRAGGRRTISR